MNKADSQLITSLIVELSDPKKLQNWKLESRHSVGRGGDYWCMVKYSSGMYINTAYMEILQSGRSVTVKGFWARHKFGKVLEDAIEYLKAYQDAKIAKMQEQAAAKATGAPGAIPLPPPRPKSLTAVPASPSSRQSRSWLEDLDDPYGFDGFGGWVGGGYGGGSYVYTPPRKPQEIAEEIMSTTPSTSAVPVGETDGAE